MLDIRSKAMLEYLVKECKEGSYRVIDANELIGAVPKKFKADIGTVNVCMEYLEKGNYVSVKYKDDNMFCLTPLPFARQMLENESNIKAKCKKFFGVGSLLYILVFVFAFLGSFLAIIIYGLIF